jgi:hypothetical protein
MGRCEFAVVFCASALFFELASWLLGFGFDHDWVMAVSILVPVCAWLMPDRKKVAPKEAAK